MEYCLLPDGSRVAISSVLGSSNANGEMTLQQINVIDAAFRDSIIADAPVSTLSKVVGKFGDSFYTSLNETNAFLQTEFAVSQLPKYEKLNERVQAGKITPTEYAQFIDDYNYTPINANIVANQNQPGFLEQLDDFYNGDFTSSVMGGFCGLLPKAFGVVGAFFGLIGELEGLIGDALSFINKIKNIKNPLEALFDKIKVKALIEALQEKIAKVVEKTLKKVAAAVENFSIENTLATVNSIATRKLAELQDSIGKFFSKENIDAIKNKVKGMIDYAVNLFANPTLEEIMFLAARMCAFAAGIEAVVNNLKAPLDKFQNRFEKGFAIAQAVSRVSTSEVIAAGAIRFDESTRQELINKGTEAWIETANYQPEERNEYDKLPKWSELEAGSNPNLKITGPWIKGIGRDGWNELDNVFRIMLMRLQEDIKEAGIANYITLHAGWRSQQWNEKQQGTADDALHLSGQAAKISYPGYDYNNDDAAYVFAQARTIGFKGIGVYKEYLHIDRGQSRTFGIVPEPPVAASAPENNPSNPPATGWSDSDAYLMESYIQDTEQFGPQYVREQLAQDRAGTSPSQKAGLGFGNFSDGQRAYLESKGY